MPGLPPSPPLDLHGYHATVAGGSRGIGCSMALAQAGAAASSCTRGANALEKTCTALVAGGVTARAERCDLAGAAAVAGCSESAAAAWGGIAVPVNNGTNHG
ncbi:MAG TPA: SDR family NAD(P)-dependent oxidoreductase [Rhodanobacter sp.]|nr:SDR family NAD(P)-dependent oxidoreductase [Rhodanobacter sp.]